MLINPTTATATATATATSTTISTMTTKLLAARLPHNHGRRKHQKVPKGCLAVNVGEADGEQQRFVVPVIWFNHPLFVELLKEAEDEYGFEQKGTITIPCNVHHFCTVVSRIIHHYRRHQQSFGCFRVWAG